MGAAAVEKGPITVSDEEFVHIKHSDGQQSLTCSTKKMSAPSLAISEDGEGSFLPGEGTSFPR